MKQIKLFGLNGAMCDLNNILNKLDEDYNDNMQWINDCLKAAKIRTEDVGTLVPVTPKGRPKTRLFLKKRALQLELVNRLNFSHKSGGSTPKNNKSVSLNVTPHYLNKSVSLKKKLLAKAIKDDGERAKKNNQPDPIRTVLFKSPDFGTKKPATSISGDVEGATTKVAAQEVKKTTGKTRGRPPKSKVIEKVETKPVVRKGRPRLPLIDEKLKGNLESLVDNLLSPIKNKPALKTTGRPAKEKPTEVMAFKSPTKEVKSKIDTGLDAVKRKKAATKKHAVKNISEEEMVFEECETVEVCDKSLQVSFPSMAKPSGNSNANLNPCVRLVDIGIGLSNAIKNKCVKVSDSTGEYYSISDNNCPKSAEMSKALPNIYSSTPAHKNPNHLLMLQKLNLTRISVGGSPPGRTLDKSEVSYEVPQPRRPLHPATDAIVIDDSCTGTREVADKDTKDGEVPRQTAFAKAAPTMNGILTAACNPKNKISDHPLDLPCKPHFQNNQLPTTSCTPVAAIVTQNIENQSSAIPAALSTKSALPLPPLMNGNCVKGPVSNSPSVEVVEISSYEMTPVRKNKRFLPSTTDDYNIRDLDSDDSTDDECRPRKVIPAWAKTSNLNRVLIRQSQIPLDEIHKMFESVVHENLNLKEIFSQKNQFRKRTSSACWDHPTPKKSRF